MKSKQSLAALTAFLLLGGAAITSAQTSGTTNPTGAATSAGTPSLSPSPPGATLPAGTPSVTPTSNVTPDTPPSPGGDLIRGGTIQNTTPNSGQVPYPGGDVNQKQFNPVITQPRGTTVTPDGTTMYPGRTTTVPGALGMQDAKFMDKAARSGLAEVQLATLALQVSNDDQVRSFAQQMIRDHGEANSQLMRLATAKGVVLPTTLAPADQNSLRFLQRQTGNRFNSAYLRQQLRAHRQALELFQEASRSVADMDVANFFAQHSDHIAQHLSELQTLAQVPEE